VEIDCYDAKSSLQDNTGTAVSFGVLCNSAARASAGALAWLHAKPLLLQQLAPGGRFRRGACAERKSPKSREQASCWLAAAHCARA
jgi:hypothetical protein